MGIGADEGNFAVLSFYQNTGEQRSCFISRAGEDSLFDQLFNHAVIKGNGSVCIKGGKFRIIIFIH